MSQCRPDGGQVFGQHRGQLMATAPGIFRLKCGQSGKIFFIYLNDALCSMYLLFKKNRFYKFIYVIDLKMSNITYYATAPTALIDLL